MTVCFSHLDAAPCIRRRIAGLNSRRATVVLLSFLVGAASWGLHVLAADGTTSSKGDAENLVLAADHAGLDAQCHLQISRWLLLDTDKDWASPEAIIWTWDAATAPELDNANRKWFSGGFDGKYIDDGKSILICADNGGAARIDRKSEKAIWYTTTRLIPGKTIKPANHSIALLPDGNAVVACDKSVNGNGELAVIVTDTKISTFPGPDTVKMARFPLEGAHGVEWHSRTKLVWALGATNLVAFEYDNSSPSQPSLVQKHCHPVPGATGHDLYPTADGTNRFYVTTNGDSYLFDPRDGTWVRTLKLPAALKSISQDPLTKRFAYTTADPGPPGAWWTATLRVEAEGGTETEHTLAGAQFYKVRWYKPHD